MATPTPTPTPAPPPAPASPTTLSPVTRRRRRAGHAAPPARITYTRHAIAADQDDRIIASSLNMFYKIMAWAGGVAVLTLILLGGIWWGKATVASSQATSPALPAVVRRVIQPPVPPRSSRFAAPRWSRDECERYYALTLHEAPAGRCN